MHFRNALTIAALGTALVGGTLIMPAQAAETTPAATQDVLDYGCPNGGSYWTDWYGGRGRAHFSCSGFRVRIGIHCTDGGSYFSGDSYQPTGSVSYRLNYNKVECPVGYSTIGNPTIQVK
ncbi:hypothetical protein ABZ802_30780 [Streptomyces sp. NPDC047737]|jgi:hypothetical protein|uniref:hypothetical protein n=1 Tax=Streptomyces sp. NPDC047737 TaxID=3155740 RepID=UPI0033F98CAE